MKTNKTLTLAAMVTACALLFPAVTRATPIVTTSFGDVSTVPGFSGDYGGSGIPTANSAYTQISGLTTPQTAAGGSALLALSANDRYATGGPVTYAGNNTFDATGQWDFNFFEAFNGGAIGTVTLNYGIVGGVQNSILLSLANLPNNPEQDSWYNGFAFLLGPGFGSSYDPNASLTYDYSLTASTANGTISGPEIFVAQNGGSTSVPDKTSTLPILGTSIAGLFGIAAFRRKNQRGVNEGTSVVTA